MSSATNRRVRHQRPNNDSFIMLQTHDKILLLQSGPVFRAASPDFRTKRQEYLSRTHPI